MIKIKQAIIVEGKYDKIKLSGIVDAFIIETGGFSIFKDRERINFIRKVARRRGIVILTDSDAAGFKIRSYIGGSLPPDQVIHAYIPDVLGKEKRKDRQSSEGKLGVEGVSAEVLLQALIRAGVTCEAQHHDRLITKTDLYEDGLSGGKNSLEKRKKLLRRLSLPERLSANAMLETLNLMMSYDEYKKEIESV